MRQTHATGGLIVPTPRDVQDQLEPLFSADDWRGPWNVKYALPPKESGYNDVMNKAIHLLIDTGAACSVLAFYSGKFASR